MRIHTNSHGLQLHVGGRKRPLFGPHTHPQLFKGIERYRRGTGAPIPTPPDSFSYFSSSLTAQADILGNDELGDCTSAGALHGVEAVTAAAGAAVIFTVEDAIKFYGLATGYVPGDPSTDQGGDEVTVCTTWRDKGLDGNGAHAIAGWISIDPTNAALVKSCAWLFEILYFGMELADPWLNVSGNGFVWDVGAPDQNDGHCVVGCGADADGILVNSWGFLGKITYAALAQQCAAENGGNLFAILTPEIIGRAAQKAPNGYDWAALCRDFEVNGGNVPSPPPASPPVDPPVDGPPLVNPPAKPLGPGQS